MAMKCQACGTEIKGSTDVCPSCGVYLVWDSKFLDLQLGLLSPFIVGPLFILLGTWEFQRGLSDSETFWTVLGFATIAMGIIYTGFGVLRQWRRYKKKKGV